MTHFVVQARLGRYMAVDTVQRGPRFRYDGGSEYTSQQQEAGSRPGVGGCYNPTATAVDRTGDSLQHESKTQKTSAAPLAMSDVGLLSPISVLTDDSFNQDPSVVRLKTPPPLPLPIPVWASKVIALLCGLVFGFALHKAGVYRAAVIIHQFYFSEFRMLKVRAGDGSSRGRGVAEPLLAAVPVRTLRHRRDCNSKPAGRVTAVCAHGVRAFAVLGRRATAQ